MAARASQLGRRVPNTSKARHTKDVSHLIATGAFYEIWRRASLTYIMSPRCVKAAPPRQDQPEDLGVGRRSHIRCEEEIERPHGCGSVVGRLGADGRAAWPGADRANDEAVILKLFLRQP